MNRKFKLIDPDPGVINSLDYVGNKKIVGFYSNPMFNDLDRFLGIGKIENYVYLEDHLSPFRKTDKGQSKFSPKTQFSAHLSLSEVKIDKNAFPRIFEDKISVNNSRGPKSSNLFLY